MGGGISMPRLKGYLLAKSAVLSMALGGLGVSAVPDSAQAAERRAIEEITVTARKKDESIQDVPIAVSAITDQLQKESVRRLEDIQA